MNRTQYIKELCSQVLKAGGSVAYHDVWKTFIHETFKLKQFCDDDITCLFFLPSFFFSFLLFIFGKKRENFCRPLGPHDVPFFSLMPFVTQLKTKKTK